MNTFLQSHLIGLLATASLASGCTTLGGSVRGDFACRAPNGDCAPMSAIDARAVEHITNAAGPSLADGTSTNPANASSAIKSRGPATRTGERTLAILLPAHIDQAGVLHDAATVHAVVEAPRWAVALPVVSDLSRSFAPSSLRASEGFGFSPARIPHPVTGVDDAPSLPPALLPTPKALAAARHGHRIARPDWEKEARAQPRKIPVPHPRRILLDAPIEATDSIAVDRTEPADRATADSEGDLK